MNDFAFLQRSLSSGMFNVLQYNNQRQIELVSTKDRKYLLKRLTQKELEVFEEIFGDYFEKMAGPAGQSSLLPRYYTIVRDQRVSYTFWYAFTISDMFIFHGQFHLFCLTFVLFL